MGILNSILSFLSGSNFIQIVAILSIILVIILILLFVLFKIIKRLSKDKNLQIGNLIKLETPENTPGEVYHNTEKDSKTIVLSESEMKELLEDCFNSAAMGCHKVQNLSFDANNFFFNYLEELVGKISERYEKIFEGLIFELSEEENILERNRIMECEINKFRRILNTTRAKLRMEMVKMHLKIIGKMIQKRSTSFPVSHRDYSEKIVVYYKLGIKLSYKSDIVDYSILKEYMDNIDGEIIEDVENFVSAYSISTIKTIKGILDLIKEGEDSVDIKIKELFNGKR